MRYAVQDIEQQSSSAAISNAKFQSGSLHLSLPGCHTGVPDSQDSQLGKQLERTRNTGSFSLPTAKKNKPYGEQVTFTKGGY